VTVVVDKTEEPMVGLLSANSFYRNVLKLEELILSRIQSDTFATVALEATQEFNACTFNSFVTLKECVNLARNVRQYYSPTGFGKFNLTLVNNSSFFILIMFMDDLSTEIHDHTFEGVFTSLNGSPLESSFIFNPGKMLNDRIIEGKLELESTQQISPGHFVKIESHSIHMLTRTTPGQYSMLVARKIPSKTINSFYLYPGLKIQNAPNSDFMSRVIKLMQMDSSIDKGILADLNLTEVLELYLRTGNQLAQYDLDPKERIEIKKIFKEELSKNQIWNHLLSHEDFLTEHNKKIFTLF
jgi:hypothetical protein